MRKVQIFQFAKYRFINSQSTDFSIRKVQILNSQSTDGSIRKVQISQFANDRFFNLQSTDFSIRKVQDFSIRKWQIFQFAKYRFFNSQRKIFNSQSTDFSIRKVQIYQFAKYRFFNSQSTDFSIRFVSQSTISQWNTQGKRAREFCFEVFSWQSPLKSYIHAGKLWQQLRFTGRSEAIAFLEIIRLVQDERSKCLHIVLFTAPRLSSRLRTTLCWDKIALRVGEVYWSSKGQDQDWKVMKLCQLSGLPVNYLLLFIFAQSLLLYIYK